MLKSQPEYLKLLDYTAGEEKSPEPAKIIGQAKKFLEMTAERLKEAMDEPLDNEVLIQRIKEFLKAIEKINWQKIEKTEERNFIELSEWLKKNKIDECTQEGARLLQDTRQTKNSDQKPS